MQDPPAHWPAGFAIPIGIQGVGTNATVRTEDGQIIPINEVGFGDFEIQALYETAAEFPDNETANRFLQIYRDSGVEVPEFLQVYLDVYQEDMQSRADAQGDDPDSLPEMPFDVQDVAPYGTLDFSEESLENINTLFEQEGLPPPEGLESEQNDEDVAQTDESDIMEPTDAQEEDGNRGEDTGDPDGQTTKGTGENAGIPKTKVDEILKTPKGSRPDPTTYLSSEYVTNQLTKFDGGVTKIVARAPTGTAGPPSGTFVMPSYIADDLIARAGGNVSQLEQLLGL